MIYPNNPGMILVLAEVLALLGKSEEAIKLMEMGLALSVNEKQKATSRAVLCFLYLKCEKNEMANKLASTLPHSRESREVTQPLIMQGIDRKEIDKNINNIILGDYA